MKVFITGASGYIGAHLARAVCEDGHAITALTRTETRARELREHFGAHAVVGALQDVDTLEAQLHDHDVLIHNALVWDALPNELELEDTRLAIKLFQAAARAGVRRVVLTSSLAVHRPFTAGMREQDALCPADTYGAIKASNELFLSALAEMHGMQTHIVRLAPVVGAPAYKGAAFNSDPRFATFVEKARRGEDIIVKAHDGRQFIAVRDAARTYAALLTSPLTRETWICTAENFTTWQHIAAAIVKSVGSSSRVIVEGEIALHSFETTKLAKLLGLRFESQAAMQEHIEHVIRFHTI